MGFNTVCISGGGFQHARAYLEGHDFFRDKLTALFLIMGGNDLERDCPSGVASTIEDLVYDVIRVNPGAVIITGTVVPRYSALGGENGFITRSEKYDGAISQWGTSHHHFLSDLFVDESDRLGMGRIRSNLYVSDKVHLNKKGRDLFLQQVQYLVECVNLDDFTGRKEWCYGMTKRATMWKF